MSFRLGRAADADMLAARFAAERRLSITDFLDDASAQALHAHLREREDWRQIVNSGDKVFDLDRATRASLSDEQKRTFDDAVHAAARHGFQHRYEAIRVDDDDAVRAGVDDPLNAFARWMSGGAARDFLRHVTGSADIAFADAQATAYGPGDFLTAHDDDVAGKHRRAAYVMGLTPQWRTEWGGLLLFHEAGNCVSGLVPAFNTLNLFAVPQLHSVSMVTPSAPYRRYAITGWLRGSGKS